MGVEKEKVMRTRKRNTHSADITVLHGSQLTPPLAVRQCDFAFSSMHGLPLRMKVRLWSAYKQRTSAGGWVTSPGWSLVATPSVEICCSVRERDISCGAGKVYRLVDKATRYDGWVQVFDRKYIRQVHERPRYHQHGLEKSSQCSPLRTMKCSSAF